jgi:hypothetical protein
LTASLLIESNGGTHRVEVRLEPPQKADLPPEGPGAVPPAVGLEAEAFLARVSPALRLIGGGIAGIALRGLIAVGDQLPVVRASAGATRPGLAGAAVVLAAAGGLAAALLATRRGEPRDLPPSAFAGAIVGVLAAALCVAICRTIEPGSVASSGLLACGLWGLFGALAAAGSLAIVPHRDRPPQEKAS